MNPKTRQTLIHKANGYQSKQIASMMCVHRRTVEWRLKQACNELHAKNVCHAIAMAVRDGVILSGEIGIVIILTLSCFVTDPEIRRGPSPPRTTSRTVRRDSVI